MICLSAVSCDWYYKYELRLLLSLTRENIRPQKPRPGPATSFFSPPSIVDCELHTEGGRETE
jgi:hypothetical protein